MLTAPLTVLSIRCPSIVYVNSPSHGFRNKVYINAVVYVNSPSHGFKNKVYISILCYQPLLSQF
jgi:hypothetical protein